MSEGRVYFRALRDKYPKYRRSILFAVMRRMGIVFRCELPPPSTFKVKTKGGDKWEPWMTTDEAKRVMAEMVLIHRSGLLKGPRLATSPAKRRREHDWTTWKPPTEPPVEDP